MNKKFLQILLIIFIIGIWGKVGYDFYKYKGQKATITQPSYIPFIAADGGEPFTYSLSLNYRDPFLGKYAEPKPAKRKSISRSKKLSKTPEKNKEPIKVKQKVIWPRVEYVGNIRNEKTKKESVTLKVGGRESFMLPGHEIQGVKLKALYPDSLVIEFQEEEKTILR